MKMSKAFDLPLQRAVNELAIVDKNDCVVGWADAFSGEVARDCIVESINSYDRIQQENAELLDCIAKNEQFITWLIENLPKDVLDDISHELSEMTMRNMKTLNKND